MMQCHKFFVVRQKLFFFSNFFFFWSKIFPHKTYNENVRARINILMKYNEN